MTKHLRRFVRPTLFLLLATAFTACHFHGHCFGPGFGHAFRHCAPVRHCR